MKHKHHIIPRHLGGTDEPSNIVHLTIEEHANAHKELYKKHGRWQDRLAWLGLSGQIGKEEILAEIYKNRIPGHTGKKHSEESKELMRMAMKGRKLTEEHKKKITKGLMGHVQPQSQKDKVAEKLSREYIITDPQGNTHHIKNLNKFCRENNLDQGNMTRVSNGKKGYNQHKGYLCTIK